MLWIRSHRATKEILIAHLIALEKFKRDDLEKKELSELESLFRKEFPERVLF